MGRKASLKKKLTYPVEIEIITYKSKDKVSTEKIEESFETFKEKRDAVHEFEVELAEHQIEKLVDEGIYIKVSFGIKQSGIVFIPNYQLDIIEEDNQKKYKVYIRETTSYFVYNKEYSDKNQYIKGRNLIRQLTNDNWHDNIVI